MEKYLVYGKPDCPFCDNAKAMLTVRDKEFQYLSLDVDYHKEDMIEMVVDTFGITPRTFPQIILTTDIGATYIGGFEQLRDFLNKQENKMKKKKMNKAMAKEMKQAIKLKNKLKKEGKELIVNE